MLEKFQSYFLIAVAAPVLLACYYIIQLIEWLKANFPIWLSHNWGYVLLAGVLCAAPLYWKVYQAFAAHWHETRDREAFRGLLEAASAQARKGYDVELVNPNTGATLKLSNPFTALAQQAQIAQQQQLALGAGQPEAIAAVIHYEDIKHRIPADKSLLGVHPATGELELTAWEKLKCVWLVGSSSTGKSNTIYGKALEAVEKGAKLLVVDQHAQKEDSLARKLAPLSHAFLCPIAVSDNDVLSVLKFFKTEFDRRVSGAPCEQKIVLICDEMNRMNRNEKLRDDLKEIVAICGEESRGFGMYGWFLSQKCAGLKWLRDSAITVIAHRLTRFEEALLACNDDRKAAKRLLEFVVGRSYIYGVDFDEPVELQQVLYPVVESTLVVTSPLEEEDEDGPEQDTEELPIDEDIREAMEAYKNGVRGPRALARELGCSYYRARELCVKLEDLID